MPGALPITYYLTRRQTVTAALRVGLIAAAVTLPVAAVIVVAFEVWSAMALPPVVFVGATLLTWPFVRRGGIRVDESGIRPLRRAARRHQVSWHLITDVRAERRASRTVPVVYLKSGRHWRLGVPYSGVMLGADPRFDEKLCVIRNTWDTYRLWRRPPVTDEDYSNTSVEG